MEVPENPERCTCISAEALESKEIRKATEEAEIYGKHSCFNSSHAKERVF